MAEYLGPAGSQGALITLTVDLGAFNAQLQRFLDLTDAGFVRVLSAQALDLQRAVQQKTPVLTGRLRNSIHTVLPARSDSFSYKDNQGRSFDGTLPVSNTLYSAVVGTNVNYAVFIEAGSSRKAPNGMFGVSVREKTGDLEAEIESMLQEEWDRRG